MAERYVQLPFEGLLAIGQALIDVRRESPWFGGPAWTRLRLYSLALLPLLAAGSLLAAMAIGRQVDTFGVIGTATSLSLGVATLAIVGIVERRRTPRQ